MRWDCKAKRGVVLMKKAACAVILAAFALSNTVPAAADTPQKIGVVLSTDILAYINEKPIASYNYADATYIMAKDLQDYGYDVLWDGAARTVKITRPQGKSMKAFSAAETEKLTQRQTVGQKRFDVYQTDIRTMFDDTVQTKSDGLPTAINVNGRTLVLFSALGKHFGEVEYHDRQRIAAIWDSGESDAVSAEQLYTEALGISYHKTGRFDLTGCSVLKSQTAAKDVDLTAEDAWQKTVDVICITKPTAEATQTENYLSVCPALMDLLGVQVGKEVEHAVSLHTEKDTVALKNANVVQNFSPAFVHETDLQLDARIVAETFPAFLQIDNQLYISADALAENLEMEHTLDSYGYGEGGFTKK